jgi:hypothetical protein
MAIEDSRVEDMDGREIAASEAELRRLEPEVEGAVIHSLVQDVYDELSPAKVQSYLPILIVREVREILRTRRAA